MTTSFIHFYSKTIKPPTTTTQKKKIQQVILIFIYKKPPLLIIKLLQLKQYKIIQISHVVLPDDNNIKWGTCENNKNYTRLLPIPTSSIQGTIQKRK